MRFIDIMQFRPPTTPVPARTPLLVMAISVAAALLWTFSLPEGAAAKSTKRTVLGKSKSSPAPNCGRAAFSRDCAAEGKVTAYQSLTRGKGGSFVVPYKRGKLVSWSISLSRPLGKAKTVDGTTHAAESPFFNQLFGSPAKARVSVLRRVQKKKKGPPRYKMVRQSPVQILNPYFGKTVHFALAKPLNVIKGQVIGLTIPTWAPAFWKPWACSASEYGGVNDPAACARATKKNTYRASRGPDKCKLGYDNATKEPNEALRKSRPQQKVNSIKRYGCYYGGNRLLYTATVVAK